MEPLARMLEAAVVALREGVEPWSLASGWRSWDRRALVFQQFHLVPYLTAVENVMLARHFHGLADRREAAEALATFGLETYLGHLPGQLSGGER